MNLVNFTYQMQFSLVFFNTNDNTTKRMNVGVINETNNEIHDITNLPRRKVRNEFNLLQSLYENISNTSGNSKNTTKIKNTSEEFNVKYQKQFVLYQRIKMMRNLAKRAKNSSGKIRPPWVTPVRKNRTADNVRKLMALLKTNLSGLAEEIDLVRIDDLKGNRRIKRAMSVLVRQVDESEIEMAGLPNTLAPKYHELRKKRKLVREYGARYANMTNRTSEEELHFMNYTELKDECENERAKIIEEAQELNEFYELEDEEEAAEMMQNMGTYEVDQSELELKIDLMNNVTSIEYRIHNPDLYPDDDAKENLAKLKEAEERVASLENKQFSRMKKKAEDYRKILALGRTTQKSNLTTLPYYKRPRYISEQEVVFGTLYRRFQKDKTLGDFGQDSDAEFHLLRQSGMRSKLESRLRDGPNNYVN
ncbi:hypothetical protein M8J76_008292 [Diaphorina citri]|nr:hypothetical protein M8J75_003149 [Diaphorina citri]KAI5716543.1 hypothetical protein M8J76_008292 [Diaphorina citri]